MDIRGIKKFIHSFIELEIERATLQEQIILLEKNVNKMENILENAEESKHSLENSSFNMFLFGIFKKKEERLEQEEIKVRRAREDFNFAQFELDSAKERLLSVIAEIDNSEDKLQELLNLLENEDKVIKENVVALKEISNMRYLITEDIANMKAVLKRAEEIWVYGDIHVDFTGTRYNKRDSTLRDHTILIEREISNLIEHMERYNTYAPDEIKLDYHEGWMDNKAYWEGQEVAVDSHGRIKRVNDWFCRFNSLWNELKSTQDETEERMRNQMIRM